MKIKKNRRVEILAVGSELLSPYFQDTNSLYLTQRLNDLGLEVQVKTIVGDQWEDLCRVFRQALDRSDLLIATGGLGPTKDDRTREALASVLGRKLILKSDLLEAIEKRFARRQMSMPEVNKKQAYIIDGAVVLENSKGTAPGLWVDARSSTIVLLPGPPHEVEPMFEDKVWPRMKTFQERHMYRLVLRTTGLTESQIETHLLDLYSRLGEVQLTTLASPGQIDIHLNCTSGRSLSQAKKRVEHAARLVCEALEENVYSTQGEELEQVVGDILKKKHQTLAVAESCTGGLLSHRITNVPGSSAYFLQGILAYSNSAKIDLLGVSSEVIDKHGAVSPQVARAMAAGIKKAAHAHYGLSVTGIAGPSGGTKNKPVGLVYIALAHARGVVVKKNLFLGDRDKIKFQSSQKALDVLRRFISEGDRS